ncbi:hypothetical protein AB6A40_003219 [Gnathostoma spinigerum]|uniref:Uncharacterized protein n=1 Tax=Gnathostoma spinigerum TaxID=75299 RepID=A0ABD6EA34_9BILA
MWDVPCIWDGIPSIFTASVVETECQFSNTRYCALKNSPIEKENRHGYSDNGALSKEIKGEEKPFGWRKEIEVEEVEECTATDKDEKGHRLNKNANFTR